MRLFCLAAVAASGVACTQESPVARLVHEQFDRNGTGTIDLDRAVPAPWQRVCIIGPYMDNEETRETLGFAWDSEKVSDIRMDDGKVLLVFVDHAGKVAFHTPYWRKYGDFSNLSGKCFTRSEAVFDYVARPAHGWPGLYPRGAVDPVSGGQAR